MTYTGPSPNLHGDGRDAGPLRAVLDRELAVGVHPQLERTDAHEKAGAERGDLLLGARDGAAIHLAVRDLAQEVSRDSDA